MPKTPKKKKIPGTIERRELLKIQAHDKEFCLELLGHV